MANPTAFREAVDGAASAVPAPASPLPLQATACTLTLPLSSPAPTLSTPCPFATPALAINLQHGLLQGDPVSPYVHVFCRFLATYFANLMHPAPPYHRAPMHYLPLLSPFPWQNPPAPPNPSPAPVRLPDGNEAAP